MSSDDLRAALGEPDDVGGTSRKYRKPAIWVYGGLEFHFDHTTGGELCLIYRETADGIVETSIGRRRANAPGTLRGAG